MVKLRSHDLAALTVLACCWWCSGEEGGIDQSNEPMIAISKSKLMNRKVMNPGLTSKSKLVNSKVMNPDWNCRMMNPGW